MCYLLLLFTCTQDNQCLVLRGSQILRQAVPEPKRCILSIIISHDGLSSRGWGTHARIWEGCTVPLKILKTGPMSTYHFISYFSAKIYESAINQYTKTAEIRHKWAICSPLLYQNCGNVAKTCEFATNEYQSCQRHIPVLPFVQSTPPPPLRA